MTRPAAALAAVLLPGVFLSGCDRPRRSPAERGESVFLRSCAGCHGSDGRGLARPGLAVTPRDLTDPALHARLTDALLRETIRQGKGQMPAFGAALPEEDVTDLVAHVRTLARHPRIAGAPAPSGRMRQP